MRSLLERQQRNLFNKIPKRAVVSTVYLRFSGSDRSDLGFIFLEMRSLKEKDLMAELKVSYSKRASNVKIISPEQSIDLFRKLWDDPLFDFQEQIYVLFLDIHDNLICWRCIGTGNHKSCIVDIRLLLTIALSSSAYKIVMAHNHPCGTAKPSHADIALTDRVLIACMSADIEFLDHFILTRDSYYSFRENANILLD